LIRKILYFFFLSAAFSLSLHTSAYGSPQPQELDKYLGYTKMKSQATGFFRVDKFGGRFFFVTPEGLAFFSIGINALRPEGTDCPALGYAPYGKNVDKLYPSREAWLDAALLRLRTWGFNTIGSWSWEPAFKKGFPYTVNLSISFQNWLRGEVADYFDPAWKQKVEDAAKKQVPQYAADPYLIGYFIDNEMKWAPDWRGNETLFEGYMKLDASTPGKQALVNLVKSKFATIADANSAFGTSFASFDEFAAAKKAGRPPRAIEQEFTGLAAEEFFRTTTSAIRRFDQNHLILGVRFHSMGAPEPVVRAAGKYCDVVSMNYYRFGQLEKIMPKSLGSLPIEGFLKRYAEVSGKPLLIGEFSFKARDSGLPNTRCAGAPVLETQADRASEFEKYVREAAGKPYIIGYHWFEYADEPALGRFDGEDCNLGLVNEKDEPYKPLTGAMERLNNDIYTLTMEKQ